MLTKEQKLEIIHKYPTHEVGFLAEFYCVTRQTIWSIAKKAGLSPKKALIIKVCPLCNKKFKTQRMHPKVYCSHKCYKKVLKKDNKSYFHDMRLKGLSIRQWQRRAKDLLKHINFQRDWVVHHLDNDLTNCTINNLFIFYSQYQHTTFHHRYRVNSLCKPLCTDGFYAFEMEILR